MFKPTHLHHSAEELSGAEAAEKMGALCHPQGLMLIFTFYIISLAF